MADSCQRCHLGNRLVVGCGIFACDCAPVVQQPTAPVAVPATAQQPSELTIPSNDAANVQNVNQVLTPPAVQPQQVVPSMVAAQQNQ